MKRVLSLCIAVAVLAGSGPACAADDQSFNVIGDLFIARPLGLAAVVLGTAVFVVSLPFALTSGSHHETADTLMGKPLGFTFRRPLGEFREEFGFRGGEPLREPFQEESADGGAAAPERRGEGPNPLLPQ
jgi:hypothetical protein